MELDESELNEADVIVVNNNRFLTGNGIVVDGIFVVGGSDIGTRRQQQAATISQGTANSGQRQN